MTNDVLIISDDMGFMMRSVLKNFNDNGFDAEIVEPSIPVLATKLASKGKKVYLIILYAGDYVEKTEELLVMIRDLCEVHGMMFCLIGYKDEIAVVKKTIPEHLISCEFERPFSMSDLMLEIKNAMAKGVSASRKKTILLVDDDVSFLAMMQKWLSIRYEVTVVKSGTLAISYLATNTPDLILLDYDMPVLSGSQVMQTIRTETNCTRVPIIFLTGKNDKDSVMKVMEMKPQGYILKSGTQEERIRMVDNYFAKHKPGTLNDNDVMLM